MPLDHKLYWIPADVYDTLKQSHLCILWFLLYSHHTLIFFFHPSNTKNQREDLHVIVCPFSVVLGILSGYYITVNFSCGIALSPCILSGQSKLLWYFVFGGSCGSLKVLLYCVLPETLLLCAPLYLTKPAPRMYIEEFILVDVVTLLYKLELNMHGICSSLYTLPTIEEKG